ncbi:hypothetical protein Moror_7292 [Moniliophthora roreri MCA 2997]|uniref:Uncharacterized protein n=1 Tax=Moniliophthora roreri (strain MCA 2997) TaxID=1381753 RepID=V2XTJ2_MONRO|nr:hypothetical protein Moror_7292 [Moniliophthora roreri MCA 2997]
MSTRFKNITFDDRDSRLQYNGFWFNTGTWNASSVGQTGTLSSSNDPAANITFNFPEPANAFYYYGIPRSRGGRYAICIDCDPNNPNFVSIDGVNTTDDGRNPPVLLYSQEFNMGQHVVILTNQPDTRFPDNNSQITIDRFEIQVIDSTPVETLTPSQLPTTSSSSSSGTPQATSGNSSTNVGAIAGGVIGGCAAILALIAIAFFFWRRRYRNTTDNTSEDPSMHEPRRDGEPVGIAPYILGTSSQNTLANSASITALGASSRRPKHAPTPSLSTYVSTSSSGPSSSDAGTSSTSSSRQQWRRERRRERRREVDAGRIEEQDDDGETLPPDYDQVFRPPTSPQNLSSTLSGITGSSDSRGIPQAPLSPQRRKE